MAEAMSEIMQKMQNENAARSKGASFFELDDREMLKAEILMGGVKRVLEFGPGMSTDVFLELGVEHITTCENVDKWFKVAKDKYKGDKRVRVLKFHDEMPCVVDGLGEGERFDLAFVDAPKGFNPVRKIHQGFGDCSRFNTLLYALSHANVVILHDAIRPLERGSLGRLWSTGRFDIEFLPTRLGMARISFKDGDKNAVDSPDPEKPRGSTARAKPKRARKPVNRRPHRPDPGIVAEEEHSGEHEHVGVR